MRIVCPTCNAAYNIASNKIPPGRGASATCKKCGGKIVIEARAEKIESVEFQSDTLSNPGQGSPRQIEIIYEKAIAGIEQEEKGIESPPSIG